MKVKLNSSGLRCLGRYHFRMAYKALIWTLGAMMAAASLAVIIANPISLVVFGVLIAIAYLMR